MSMLNDLNKQYLQLHTLKEESFWASKMDLSGDIKKDMEKNEIALMSFISDASWLPKLREELKKTSLSEDEKIGLQGWLRFFEVNSIENEEAKEITRKIVKLEGELARARRNMELGYVDPESGDFVRASSIELSLMLQTSEIEDRRKAGWDGLRSIENYVLDNGLLEIFKLRNHLGRLLGFKDFYDYRVHINEGFAKEKLFELLDELEENTRQACKKSVEKVREEKGDSAIEPWNFDQATAGDLTTQKDPYLSFATAVERWGRSFAALGIDYSGATLTLDLIDRKGKYENGFMHGPFPAFVDNGEFRPAKINFTANAVPGRIGSGNRAIQTLFHEGGHAAHFSNIKMPAPCFSQEFAPTSIAYAETQSMFCDSIIGDADWLNKYALDKDGNPMPWDLIKESLIHEHENRAHYLRRLMTVPYVEKQIYELPDEEINAENVLKIVRDTEARMSYQSASGRPILSIPHLLESDSSAYYHAYVLAQMAVYQTRAFFLKRDGYIMDNPQVGKDLAEIYWNPGNSKSFLDLVNELTGDPFSAKATIDLVNQPVDEVLENSRKLIAKAEKSKLSADKVDLNATIYMINGDEVISNTSNGSGFEKLAADFSRWIKEKE